MTTKKGSYHRNNLSSIPKGDTIQRKEHLKGLSFFWKSLCWESLFTGINISKQGDPTPQRGGGKKKRSFAAYLSTWQGPEEIPTKGMAEEKP